MSIKALECHLGPLRPFIDAKGVTEICINQPGQVFVEQNGKFSAHFVPELELRFLEGLAALLAEFNNKDFPVLLIAGSLPTGERVQLVMSPACENQKIIFSIRKQQIKDISLDDYAYLGAFAEVSFLDDKNKSMDSDLGTVYHHKDILSFLKLAIYRKKNILISGGTGTGKTTFLNACLKLVPQHERIITAEDTREVKVNQPNAVHLLFNEEVLLVAVKRSH